MMVCVSAGQGISISNCYFHVDPLMRLCVISSQDMARLKSGQEIFLMIGCSDGERCGLGSYLFDARRSALFSGVFMIPSVLRGSPSNEALATSLKKKSPLFLSLSY